MTETGSRSRWIWYVWPLILILGLLLLRFLTGESSSAGAKLYERHCANCHMEEGQGLKNLIPSLASSLYVQSHGADMACLLYHGSVPATDSTRRQLMPANPDLSALELASLINFLKNSWGNSGESVKVQDVEAALKQCQDWNQGGN